MYYDRPGEGTKFFNSIDNRPDGRVDMGGMCILVTAATGGRDLMRKWVGGNASR